MKMIKHIFNDLSLRGKLVASYIIIGIAPLLVMGFLAYQQISNMLIVQESENMESYLIQAKLTLENEINVYDNLSNYLSYNNEIKNVIEISQTNDDKYQIYTQYRDILDPTISSILYFHDDLEAITYYVPNLKVDYANTLVSFQTATDQFWYDEVMSDSNIHWFIQDQTIFSIRKVYIQSDMTAILYIQPNFNDLMATLTSSLPDNYGVNISKNGEQVYGFDSFSNPDMISTVDNIQNSSDYIYQSSEVSNSNISLNVYRPKSLAVNNLNPIFASIGSTVAIVAIATMLALFLISRYIVNRINVLADYMQKVEKGNFNISLSSDSKDEIGELIRGFSQMTGRIKRLIDDLYISKINQKEYELRALQQQINPHFLYNTLSMINFKAIQANNPDISRITLSLAAFYRTALNRGNNICTIASELANIRAYIDLELMMHDHSFDVVIEVDDNLNDYETLNLILQPLIENAINHGIDLLEDKRGLIRVLGTMADGIVYLIIEDNGVGMTQDTIDTILTTNSKGYGVFNVHERIKLFYGNDYGVHMESIVNQGTFITVIFPARKFQLKEQ